MPEKTPAKVKQVIVMRSDLGMRRGKQVAQGAHASLAFLAERLLSTKAGTAPRLTADEMLWLFGDYSKICCRVDSEEELLAIHDKAMADGLEVHLITDIGKTEFNGIPTRTCLAIGPAEAEDIDRITGHLSLL